MIQYGILLRDDIDMRIPLECIVEANIPVPPDDNSTRRASRSNMNLMNQGERRTVKDQKLVLLTPQNVIELQAWFHPELNIMSVVEKQPWISVSVGTTNDKGEVVHDVVQIMLPPRPMQDFQPEELFKRPKDTRLIDTNIWHEASPNDIPATITALRKELLEIFGRLDPPEDEMPTIFITQEAKNKYLGIDD